MSVSFQDSNSVSPAILSWSEATIGYDNELPRIDWVKNWVKDRVKNYAFPDYSKRRVITNNEWTINGWQNTFGNGFIVLSLKIGTSEDSYKNITLYKIDETGNNNHAQIAFWGGIDFNICTPIPVLNGEKYILKGISSSSSTSYAADDIVLFSNEDAINVIPTFAVFYPIKMD